MKVGGELAATTATEFRLLEYLARHPGRVFSRDHLLDAVWGDARFVTPRSVDVYVRRIREKIESDPENPQYLKTVRGAGYRFEMPKKSKRICVAPRVFDEAKSILQAARGDVPGAARRGGHAGHLAANILEASLQNRWRAVLMSKRSLWLLDSVLRIHPDSSRWRERKRMRSVQT